MVGASVETVRTLTSWALPRLFLFPRGCSRGPRIRQTRLPHRRFFSPITSSGGDGDGAKGDYLRLTDEELMQQCHMVTFKASGPGGQHRNKRESAVRLKHLPSGIISQGMQALLDLLLAVQGSVSDAAKMLGLSTGALSRLLLSDDSLRVAVNELRSSKGLRPLK